MEISKQCLIEGGMPDAGNIRMIDAGNIPIDSKQNQVILCTDYIMYYISYTLCSVYIIYFLLYSIYNIIYIHIIFCILYKIFYIIYILYSLYYIPYILVYTNV